MKSKKVLAFDFDGVFVNSNELKVDAIATAILSERQSKMSQEECRDYIRHSFGRGREKIIASALKGADSIDIDRATRMANRLIDNKYEAMTILNEADVIRYLGILKNNYKIVIISGSPLKSIVKILGKNIDYFDNIYSTNVFFSKSFILQNLKKFSDVELYVGDAIGDYEAASIAGIDFVFISQDSVAAANDVKTLLHQSVACYRNLDLFLNEKVLKLRAIET